MIAELVAFNAAFGVVKQFIENGKDLHDCFGQIGQMVNALEDKNAHIQKINQRMHYAGLAVGCALVCVGLYACFTIIFAIAK